MAEPENKIALNTPEARHANAMATLPEPGSLSTTNAPATGALSGGPAEPSVPAGAIQPTNEVRPDDRSRFRQVTDKVANFISGGQQTPGSVWRGILSGALTGMAAGAGQGHAGPGMSAGAQAAMKLRQQQFENKLAQTKETSEAQLRAAQIAKSNHDIWETTQNLMMRQQEATIRSAQNETQFQAEVMKMSGDSKDLGLFVGKNGVITDEEIQRVLTQHPEIHQDAAKGNIFVVPHYAPTGVDDQGRPTGMKYAGLHAFYVPPDVGNQKITEPTPVPMFVHGDKPGEPGHWIDQNYGPESGLTKNQILQMRQKQQELEAKYDSDTAIAKAQLEAAQATLSLAKAGAVGKQAVDLQEQLDSTARGLVEKDITPDQVPKRGKEWYAMQKAADAYSMAHYGKHYDAAKDKNDFAEATKYRYALDNMNALVGIGPGAGGILDQLISLSNKIPRTKYPALNDAAAWAKLEAGDPMIPAYKGLLNDTADKIGKILQGGGTNSSLTDAKLKQAGELISIGFNPDQLLSAANTSREAMLNTKKAYIANNGYLMKWYGPNSDLVKNAASINAQFGGTPGAGGTGNVAPSQNLQVPGLPANAIIQYDEHHNPYGYSLPGEDPKKTGVHAMPPTAGGV